MTPGRHGSSGRERFVGRTDELDALQRRVAIRIASKLKGQLTQVQEQAIARKPMSSAALDLYLPTESDLARDRDPAKLPAAQWELLPAGRRRAA